MAQGSLKPVQSDRDLWSRAVAGESSAFGALFDRHAAAIYNFCFRRTADRASSEDLLSTTFLHAWRRRHDLRLEGETILPWLYGIAANLTRRHLRGLGRRRVAFARLQPLPPEPDPADDLPGRLDDERRAKEALGALALLTEREQELFVLCVWQELSYQEAAVALDIPVGTVRSRLSRARARLREALAEPDLASGDERSETIGALWRKGDQT